jgi:prophage maintenance system killer protein
VIPFEASDAILVASKVLDTMPENVLAEAELAAIERIVDQARSSQGGTDGEQVVLAAAALLVGFVRLAPFPEANEAVALACVLQFLSLNGWDLEPGPPELVREQLERIRAEKTGRAQVAAWIRGILVEAGANAATTATTTRERGMFQRRRRKESEAYLNRFFNRFTDRAKRSIALAQEEAEALGHPGVAPEHLVLGMLRIPESVGAKALATLGVTLDAARGDLACRPGSHDPAAGRAAMEPQTKWVLQLAVKEAGQLDDRYIGTEHFLLALSHLPVVCSGPDGHSRVAPGLGLTTGMVRKAVFRVLTGSPAAGDQPDRQAILDQINDVFVENERLRAEVERLRTLLEERGTEPDEGAPGTA